jgi:hypothetical protein
MALQHTLQGKGKGGYYHYQSKGKGGYQFYSDNYDDDDSTGDLW